jgi:Putative restriction endonuclease
MSTVALDSKTVSTVRPPLTNLLSQFSHLRTEADTPELWPSPDDPSVENLVTENDDPVDNIFSEKQQRFLTESLYASWTGPGPGRSFITLANVGLFYILRLPPIVPDVLVSLDVHMPTDVWTKSKRSYMVWEYGKPPDVVIEIVSNREGEEDGRKFQLYAQAKVPYYVIFDPVEELRNGVLRLYERRGNRYVEIPDRWLPGLQLGLTLWEGWFEDKYDVWLRWCDREGHLLLTNAERTQQERQQKELERQQKELAVSQLTHERQQKDLALSQLTHERQEKELAQFQRDQLVAQLRSLGIDPDKLLNK